MTEPELNNENDDQGLSTEGMLLHEEDLMDRLLGAAKQREQAVEIMRVRRPDDKTIYFEIRLIGEEEDEELIRSTTIYEQDRKLGIDRVKKREHARYRSLLIILATTRFLSPKKGVEDPKAPGDFDTAPNMWESKDLRERLGLHDKAAVVDKILTPGEKDFVIERIEKISGLYDEDKRNDELKN